MPKAVVDPNLNSEKHELKTCPGGYVTLRQLTYGQQIQKQQMAAKMTLDNVGKGAGAGEFEFFQRKVAEYEFATCIVEHNLEDNEGKLLDFKNPRTLDTLDPRIGSEISLLINQANSFEDIDFLEES